MFSSRTAALSSQRADSNYCWSGHRQQRVSVVREYVSPLTAVLSPPRPDSTYRYCCSGPYLACGFSSLVSDRELVTEMCLHTQPHRVGRSSTCLHHTQHSCLHSCPRIDTRLFYFFLTAHTTVSVVSPDVFLAHSGTVPTARRL